MGHHSIEKKSKVEITPYDFDKYEMMSTSNQMQHLLSQKQDTPKGSSASEDGQGDNNDEEVKIEYVQESQVNARHHKPFSQQSSIGPQQMQEEGEIGISPEPTRKYNHT